MPSLKEVKNRITSVQSTRKITSAMKMVASSKLHRAQQTIENLCPYEKSINSIMSQLVSNVEDYSSAYTNIREFKRLRLLLFLLIPAFVEDSIKTSSNKS